MTKFRLLLTLLLLSPVAMANIAGTHLQNFNPTTNGLDFVTVQSSNTLDQGVFNLSVFANYATNSLPFFKLSSAPSGQVFSEPSDELTSMDFGLGLGLSDNWDLGFSVATVIGQSIDNNNNLGVFSEKGVTEFKINTKYRLIRQDDWGLALVGSANIDRIENNPFSGRDPGPTFNLDLAYDRHLRGDLLLGFNLGYRLRDEGQVILNSGVSPIPDQITYSLALAYLYRDDLTFIFELFGSSPSKGVTLPVDREASNLEVLAGARYSIMPNMNLHGGIGTEVYHGLATPDIRVYAGLTFQFGPFWGEPGDLARVEPVIEPHPVPQPIMEEQPDQRITLHNLNFATGSTSLIGSSLNGLQGTIDQLKQQKADIAKIIVEGHTDNVGSESMNMDLSNGRARTVKNIIQRELHTETIEIQSRGYGESQPVGNNSTKEGRHRNRRVELRIYNNK